ncbi:MAG: hypothetical protein WEB52_02155 [Dehalococcoidia bacterium]
MTSSKGEEVQQQLGFRVSTELVAEGDVEARISQALPEGMKPLAPAIAVTAREVIQRVALRVLQSDEIHAVLDVALTEIHGSVVRILEGEGNVAFSDGAVVLDLRAILQETAADFDRDNGSGLLDRLNLPEDSGQVVLIEDAETASTIQSVIARHDTIVWIALGATVACYALAVAVARDRRVAIRNAGFVLLASGVLAVVILAPVRPIVASYAQNPNAAEHVFDHLVNDYRTQAFLVVLAGLTVGAGAMIAGDTRLARAARGTVLRSEGAAASDFADEIPKHAPALRLAGLVVGALLLTAWPEPMTRVFVTIMARKIGSGPGAEPAMSERCDCSLCRAVSSRTCRHH